ncbi:catabolite repression HPr-like protein [Pullulanibacillus pueri]|uniref:HPr-like protein Crh n=1 Tax=Pullulanibacillus pueri TaxID=1437324 RepID=A0A8J2ZTQ6_9BACL|nr:HPr family phosphocarrier protein [Pullulanibacillus pueri]MBM7680237.1 catabolite repression HPr-like protein [Pullulanibacillus pueri]GGH76064.1 HPr-like protein Crh [Pullulanibacillus pueri]
MVQVKTTINLKTGLQARPAALFVQEANHFSSRVEIEKSGKKVNAKSIMGMMSIAARKGEEITIIVQGPDENEAIETLKAFVEKEEI